MAKRNQDTPNIPPVSTVTKHITIYSDNPIHDCIDRIINSCACIDEGDDRFGMATHEILEAAEELIKLAIERRTEALYQIVNKSRGYRTNS